MKKTGYIIVQDSVFIPLSPLGSFLRVCSFVIPEIQLPAESRKWITAFKWGCMGSTTKYAEYSDFGVISQRVLLLKTPRFKKLFSFTWVIICWLVFFRLIKKESMLSPHHLRFYGNPSMSPWCMRYQWLYQLHKYHYLNLMVMNLVIHSCPSLPFLCPILL